MKQDPNKTPEKPGERGWNVAEDDAVQQISQRLLEQNREAYQILAGREAE